MEHDVQSVLEDDVLVLILSLTKTRLTIFKAYNRGLDQVIMTNEFVNCRPS